MNEPLISDNSAPVEGEAASAMDGDISFKEDDHPRTNNGEFAKTAGSGKHVDLKTTDLYSAIADAEDAGGRASVEKLVREIVQERPDLAEAAYKEAASSFGYNIKPEKAVSSAAPAKESGKSKGPPAVEEAAPAAEAPYHRFTQTKGPDTGVGYMMFAENMESVESAYGPNHHTFDPGELDEAHVAYAGDPAIKRAVSKALADYPEIGGFSEGNEDAKATAVRLAGGLNPKDIVDTAELWDSPEVVSYLYEQVFEPRGIKAIETDDGAIVFDPKHVKSHAQDAVFAMDRASARAMDTNGWYTVNNNPLSKVGVFAYGGNQLPDAPDPSKVYRVYRPAEELSDPECLDSFRLLPWIDNHVMLGHEDRGLTPAERKGVQGVIGEKVYFAEDTLFGNLKVFSQSLANLIEAGKRELSCGYRCKYEWTPGVYDGQAYDVVQRQIRGNHLALVKAGRMGPDVAVLDGLALDHFTFTIDSKDSTMDDDTVTETPAASQMTVEQALAVVNAALPAIKFLQDHASTTTEAVEAVQEVLSDTDSTAADAVAEEAKAEPKIEAKASGPKLKPSAAVVLPKPVAVMDERQFFRSMTRQMAARQSLYDRLSPHVGAFDCAEMTEAEVALYGVKKLGLKAKPGQEQSMLEGYLQAAKDPRKEVTVGAMDSASADNFVTRHLNKGQ